MRDAFTEDVSETAVVMTSKDETHSNFRNVVGKFTSHTVQKTSKPKNDMSAYDAV
jgi:hypothetical protein